MKITTSTWIICWTLGCSILLSACGQVATTHTKTNMKPTHYSRTSSEKVTLTNADWEKVLSPELYAVARNADTERAFTGKLWDNEAKGTYYCAACGNLLFKS
ncbi:MAG: peptide-methionine (R)-S-oxide reductase, partial [Flavobacterium sp.]|nr:peptide-methionine (R)-S-oxide reductase [Flavobacterium sp.]